MNTGKTGREKQGFKSYLCKQCREGTLPHRPKTFSATCWGCAEKKDRHDQLQAHCGLPAKDEHHVMCSACSELSRKPMRTGNEPAPEKFKAGNWKWQAMAPEQKAKVAKRHAKANAARLKAMFQLGDRIDGVIT